MRGGAVVIRLLSSNSSNVPQKGWRAENNVACGTTNMISFVVWLHQTSGRRLKVVFTGLSNKRLMNAVQRKHGCAQLLTSAAV